jgi:hypothetical protein
MVFPTTVFHFGVLVEDIERGAERFGDVLGVRFRPPVIAHVDDYVEGDAKYVLDLKVTYSMAGPPYVELLEMQGDGLYGAHHGEGFHHIGVWEPDCEGRLAESRRKGLEPEAIQYTPEGRIIVAYFRPEGTHGARLELVDEARREQMERWIGGGDWVNDTEGV